MAHTCHGEVPKRRSRIPEEELERLKREMSLADLCRRYGIDLKPHGKDLIGLCPFHDDHDPSFVVTPQKNLWHCLGACQAGGSVIDFIMKAEGVSFRHAVDLLRGPESALGHSVRRVNRSVVPKLEPALDEEADDRELLNQVVDFYHNALKESPEALDYLQSRGLQSMELIDRFKLGFANRTLCYRLPPKKRSDGDLLRSRLQKLGILRESGHEHFNGSLIIPIFDQQNRIVEMYGRKITAKLRKGTPKHLYLPGPHYGIWNYEEVIQHPELILCESLIDAMTFWCAGYRNVTACYGVEGFMPDHLAMIKQYHKRVILAFDRDEAGEEAARKLAENLQVEGIETAILHFPHGMDANEYALKVTPANKSLGTLLRMTGYASFINKEVAAKEATEKESMPGESESVGDEAVFTFGSRRFRVRGLRKNMSYDALKVNVLITLAEGFHVDSFDLYSARQRHTFIHQAAMELHLEEDILKKDLGRVLLKLESMQERQIREALEPKDKPVVVEDAERVAAMELLKDKKLLDRILTDFDRCGIVGEHTNKLLGYLAAVSRKLEDPLAVIIQSSSAAGKSSLMEAILAFMPEEEQVKYSAMTGQSLFYMGETDLKQKILAIVEEEGAERASYALKLLQSEGELTIASTGKDPQTGRMETQAYHVEGPVMIFLTTTAIDIDEELLNRCLVLTVDENREQTKAIHQKQREAQTLEGLLARKNKTDILSLHRNAQRLLRPLLVANPYAKELTFLDDRTRTRRDHMKYLTLIRTIALLHQFQRPIKQVTHQGRKLDYIEVTLEDIATANRLANEAFGRSLDELPPQTRRLLLKLDEMVTYRCREEDIERCNCRFSRQDVRFYTGWSYEQVRVHLDRLVDYEYVLPLRGGRGQSFVYELLYDGKGRDGKSVMMNLMDVAELGKTDMTPTLGGVGKEFGVSLGAHTGPLPGPYRHPKIPESPFRSGAFIPLVAAAAEKHYAAAQPQMVVV